MWLHKLQAHALRSFIDLDLSFEPGINVLYGDNGVGKTSILEGIDILSRGKSFRTSKLSQIINYDLTEFILYGEVCSDDHIHKLGIKHKDHQSELHLNQQKVKKWSEFASILPIIDIHPETYLLVMGGPIERRKFLNWGAFHVEPSFLSTWSEYSKAVKQRNICLKTRKISEARNWHHVLHEKGTEISSILAKYCSNLTPFVQGLIKEFGFMDQIELTYKPGWDLDRELSDLLEEELLENEVPHVTQVGPHRGDLGIRWHGHQFAKTSSRGQQKIISIVLKLAQAELLKSSCGKSCVYLVDELPAELDINKQKTALTLLASLNSQVIISAVTKESIDYQNMSAKWFHVEHQSVSSVV